MIQCACGKSKLSQRFEHFSLTANYSHLCEFFVYRPRSENVAMATLYFVCLDSFHLYGNLHLTFHIIPELQDI